MPCYSQPCAATGSRHRLERRPARRHPSTTVGGGRLAWASGGQGDRFESESTVGLMFGEQAVVTPIPEGGVGLDAYANLNLAEPAYDVVSVFVIDGNK